MHLFAHVIRSKEEDDEEDEEKEEKEKQTAFADNLYSEIRRPRMRKTTFSSLLFLYLLEKRYSLFFSLFFSDMTRLMQQQAQKRFHEA